MKSKLIYIILVLFIIIYATEITFAQVSNRVGTTAANFLEIGFGPAGIAMGDAYVSMVDDISAVYWNPAGLAYMENNQAMFMVQPWIVDVNTSFAAVGIPAGSIGTFALNIINVGYGDMEVTTLSMQEGTGEIFDANEFAVALSYGRAITEGLAFGVSAKYVSSQIWHLTGSALAFDMGVLVKTEFFSYSEGEQNGLKIGMSISNYGTRLKYDGIDLINPIDILPNENGNYRDVKGQFRLNSWELPLIFRIGVSVMPLALENQKLTVAIDALHPNNNSESINMGMEYGINIPTFGEFFLRGGYKALYMESSEYGPTFGAGFQMNLLGNSAIRCNYAYRDLGVLGTSNCFGLGVQF